MNNNHEFTYPRRAYEVTEEMLSMPVERLRSLSRYPLHVEPTKEDLYKYLARMMADEIKGNNELGQPTRWILPIGPKGQYPILAEISNKENISWKNVWAFHMDEYLDWQGRPVPYEHPFSFRRYADEYLYNFIDEKLLPPREQIIFPAPSDIDAFSKKIKEVGGIDSTFAGFGYRGLIAFNETPCNRWRKISADAFANGKTRIVHLKEDTIIALSQRMTGGYTDCIPQMAINVGMADILSAKTVHLITDGGSWKQWMLRVFLLTTERDSEYAVTLCHGHPNVKVLVDMASAAPVAVGVN